MGHDDLAAAAENQVARPGQLLQAGRDRREFRAEFPGELIRVGCAPGPGERAVHRQTQVLIIHAAIVPGLVGRAAEAQGPEIALNKTALSNNMKQLAEFAAAVLGPAPVVGTGVWGRNR